MDSNKETPQKDEENNEVDDEVLNPVFKERFYGYWFIVLAAWILIIPATVWLNNFAFWVLILFNMCLSVWLLRYVRKTIARISYETGIPIYLPMTDEQKKKREEKRRKKEEEDRRDKRIVRLLMYGAIIFAVALIVVELLSEGVTGFMEVFR